MDALIGAGALREGLAVEYARLRTVAEAAPPDTPVPTCPEWTLTDLVTHVGNVYLHKVACMRDGEAAVWEPVGGEVPPVDLLDRGYQALCAEFEQRGVNDPAYTWYPPDLTVGFWLRRMTHETVIHRLDAGFATGAPLPPIATPLAVDGIDEVLRRFLAFGSLAYAAEFGADLREADGRAVLVQTAGRGWAVQLAPTGVVVTEADADARSAAAISGEPSDVLRWLWRRGGTPTQSGDPALLARLHTLLHTATQ